MVAVAEERHDAAFVIGAVLGGVAGGVWAMFNAPRTGAETRAALAEQTARTLDRIVVGVLDAEETVRASLGHPAPTERETIATGSDVRTTAGRFPAGGPLLANESSAEMVPASGESVG